MRWLWCLGLTVVAFSGCSSPREPVFVDVALDPHGRPYDAAASWSLADRTETRFVAPFHVADGELRVMDGISLSVDPQFFADEAQRVDLGSIDLVDLSIVWEIIVVEGGDLEVPLGVRIDIPGRQVETWQAFEYAYGTGGGLGGVTSAFVLDGNFGRSGSDDFLEIDYEVPVALFDVDGDGMDETLIFENGFGDGGFPMSRGFGVDGEIASLMIWNTRYPWRLAVTDGTPPPDITKREDEMIECLEGRRAVDASGFCMPDERG